MAIPETYSHMSMDEVLAAYIAGGSPAYLVILRMGEDHRVYQFVTAFVATNVTGPEPLASGIYDDFFVFSFDTQGYAQEFYDDLQTTRPEVAAYATVWANGVKIDG